MLAYLKRGAQRLGNGIVGPLRGDVTGALVTQDAHARFQEAVLNGNVWIGANAVGTPVTPQAGLSATTPVLTLYNPINSPVNLVLWEFQSVATTIQAAQTAVMLAYNVPAITGVVKAPFTVTNALITNAMLSVGIPQDVTAVQNQGAWGQCYSICTLIAAPVACRYCFVLEYLATSAVGTTIGTAPTIDHVDGAIIVPPGIALSAQFGAATPSLCAFTWEEVPISN